MRNYSSALPPPEQRTLGGILRRQAEGHPDRTFIKFPNLVWTYSELDAWVDQLANGLMSIGVRKSSKVALMLPNSAEFVGVWFACARIGAIEVPVNTNVRGHLLRHIIGHSDTEVLIVSHNLVDTVGAVLDDLSKVQSIVVCGNDSEEAAISGKRVLPFGELEQHGSAAIDHEVAPLDPMGIMFTSGTTGPSKGALLSHEYYWWFAKRSGELRAMTEDECLYTCLPLFHVNAQALTVMPALLHGQTATVDTHFTASGFWQRLKDFGATQFNYIGGIIPILMKQASGPQDRDHRVRVGLGAAAPKAQWREFEERFGLRLLECYGQTEDCVVTVNPLNAVRIGSIGKPQWGFEMRVVDDDNHEVPDGEIGEFVIRPERPGILMQGYYKMPEETLKVLTDLWFHTGDYGSRDADGYFYFMDRKKDAIRRRGENISAFEVELVVNEHPDVVESAAFAVPSDVGEDDVMVAVVTKTDVALTGADLLRHCEGKLAYFAVPRYVDFRAELPKTPTHRVEKYRLRDEGITRTTWDRDAAGYKLKRS